MPTEYYFDPSNLSLEVNGEKQELAPIVSRLLDYFLATPGSIISRKTLATNIWQSEHVSDDAINRCISLLRKTLGRQSDRFIKTIKQRGYVFNVPDDVVFHRISNSGNIVHQPADDTTDLPVKTLKWPVLLATILTFLVFLSGWQIYQGASRSDEAPGTVKTAISLQIAPIKTSGDPGFAEDLTDRLLFAISKGNKFTIITAANSQHKGAFTLETTLHNLEQDSRLAVRLINNKSQRIVLSTSVELSHKPPVKTIEQIAAAMRIVLLQGKNSQYYLNEYPKLSYIDIETLSKISEQTPFFKPQSFEQARQTLTAIYRQNPDSAMTAGLIARIYLLNIETHLTDADKVKWWAEKALSMDSNNYDALSALFGYHIYTTASREKALQVLNRLAHHFPNDRAVWENRLAWMIIFARPCSEFAQLLEQLPKTVFTPQEINGISNMIALCEGKTEFESLLTEAQKNTQLNNSAHIDSTWYFSYLFVIRHDALLEGIRYLRNQSEDPVLASETVLVQLMQNDAHGAKQTAKQYRLMHNAQTRPIIKPIAQLHQMPGAADDTEFDLTKSNLSGINALYQAGAIINQAQKDQNQSNLKKYIGLNSNFEVNIANRYQSVALIAALHFAGDLTQSQRLAKRLYFSVDNYRRSYPQSYRFWALGWFQIVTSKYCGQPCTLPYTSEPKTAGANELFTNLFAEDYAWWTDDLVLSKFFLSPWLSDPTIAQYLHLIEQDIEQLTDYSAD